MNENKIWLTIAEVCDALRISRPTLYRYWQADCGPRYSTTGGGRRRVRADWLDDYMTGREEAA